MPDFGSPIAQNTNPVGQGLNALMDITNYQRGQQALQTGIYQQQSAQATAQQDQQKNQELQALSQFTQQASRDPAYHNPDGSLNTQKFQTDASKVAPVYGQAYIGQSTLNANASIENRKALLSLSNDQRQTAGQYLAAVAAKPNATIEDLQDAVTRAEDVSDDPGYRKALENLKYSTPQVHNLPDAQASTAIRQFARGVAMQFGSPGAAASNPQVSMVQGPQGLVPTNVNPQSPSGVGQVGPTQAQGVAPGAQILKDAYDNQYVFDPQTHRVVPVGAGKGASSNGGFQQPVAGQSQVLQDVASARHAGDIAPTMRNINQQLLQLSSETKTGPGTQTIQKIAGVLGLPSGSKYQEIDAYLNRQAATSAASMGVPNTNAGLSAAQTATGTTEYTPQALQEKVKFADALNSGAMAYRQGLDKAVGTGATPNLQNYQAFRGAWAKNFDPDVFRAEDAMRHGDQTELASIKQRLGPQGMKTLAQKSANLRMLENGQIPQ